MNVELIYDADCPNVAPTRSLLINAFTRTGVSARWKEWERTSPDSPPYVQGYGSPTLLVNGEDLAGVPPSPGTRACRVYTGSDGALRSTLPLELICAALLKEAPATGAHSRRSGWQTIVASFPAIGTALLPKLTCPLCWPAYAALLSAQRRMRGVRGHDYAHQSYRLPVMRDRNSRHASGGRRRKGEALRHSQCSRRCRERQTCRLLCWPRAERSFAPRSRNWNTDLRC